MKQLNISNDKKRDAFVGLDNLPQKSSIKYVLPDGSDSKNIKILRGTMDTSLDALKNEYTDMVELGEAIIKSDPEIDTELFGKLLSRTQKLYLNGNDEIVYRIHIKEIVKAPDGTIKEERDAERREMNVTEEIPLRWTGKLFPKTAAVKKFVFSRKYQVKHVNGLTYDFLYDMAKTLAESNSLMFMGGGPKGIEPIILTTGGEPQRGFLEGRIDGNKYCLILHLTNLELKNIITDED
ncbi:hypothetical protein [Bacteroides sp. 519]|uniref:hypothetical protein n=1 Tax=Bacteroides sp. 519 TaxID=2302937 RepID=UPI0013D456A7|nr:hypothetical protein [Bacteroides sp. 519]NDV57652.1 hypothetical protein [Bacteroides sp. 519]